MALALLPSGCGESTKAGTDAGDTSSDTGVDTNADPGEDGEDDIAADPTGDPDAVPETVDDPLEDPDADSAGDTEEEDIRSGELLLLIYNVAGLPDWLSGSNPAVNTPLISPLLNGYELALVQEDLWYHDLLIVGAEHPFKSDPMIADPTLTNMGDGLNRFSVFPFGALTREAWEECNGLVGEANDCLTPKGFSVAVVDPGGGADVHVYNLHMDAGGSAGDIAAREAQLIQLAGAIADRSAGAALIVAGDTNLNDGRPEDMENLAWFLAETGLADVCRTLGCGDDRIDRIMLRSSSSVTLEPLTWYLPDEFVDSGGGDLSDHRPVAATLRWERVF